MNGLATVFKKSEGVTFHGLALLYCLGAYWLGLWGLFAGSIVVNVVAVLMLAHGMVIAAYLIHECGHNVIFRENCHNAKLGTLLTWLCGASYGTYEDIRYKHFRHHVDNDDVVWFDYEAFFKRHPLVYRVTITLEYFYIPAHDLIMHFIMVFSSFFIPQRRHQRLRNVAVIIIRGGIYFAALWYYPKVALLYCLAYMLMITVLRFMDGIQHDYPYHLTLFTQEPSEHKGDLVWEQTHTFSNVLSLNI
jgi:omega-6 fatty acid desaturase (delta-12 desaturase)